MTVRRAIPLLTAGLLGGICIAAAPPARPPTTPPLPSGKVTIGGNAPAEPANPDSTESQAVGSAGLTATSSTAPATQPSTAPAALYPDVSFARTSSTRPAPRPQAMPRELVTDAEIERSIRQATNLLIEQFDPQTGVLRNRRAVAPTYEAMETGLHALCVYALMQAYQATGDPRLSPKSDFMKAMIDSLKRMRANRGVHQTYAHALRAAALSVFNREEDRAVLREDVGCLTYGHIDGGYGYLSAHPESMSFRSRGTAPAGMPANWVDHSNTQYGLLGVWCGAEAGLDVPEQYWQTAIDHWTKTQARNGQWSYLALPPKGKNESSHPAGGTLSMTAAGIASMFVAGEYAERAKGFRVGREPFSDSLRHALDWWEQGDNALQIKREKYWGYTLYGIERVGLASGFKFFGDHDWYRVLSRQVIDRQAANGSWKDLIDTSYGLLFLARGRHPILMNKLRFDGSDRLVGDYWNNRPNDASYLARFASQQLERTLNWQIVPLRKNWSDWLDSPILYIASHQRPTSFKPAESEKLRKFVEAGGMIFTNADSDADSADPLVAMAAAGERNTFDRYISEFAAKLFPEYKLVDLPADHPLYSTVFRLAGAPKLKAVSNGSRLLLVHSPKDLAIAWQQRDQKKGKTAYEFGVNLFVYAAGKRDLRNRLDSPYVPHAPAYGEVNRITLARLQYTGNWSPEPGAWERFANLLRWKTGTKLQAQTLAAKDLRPGAAAMAHLTGTAAWKPTPTELAAIKAYVEAGGILLIDDCGGSGAFTQSLLSALAATLPNAKRTPLAPDHKLLIGGEPGMCDQLKLRLRPFSLDRANGQRTAPIEIWEAGRGAIIACSVDLTTGLLGINTWGINGYEPASAEGFVRNVVFWTLDRR